jgi:signal transduction protein with GAF and PtsI domain
MTDDAFDQSSDDLAQARAIIARQEAELADLRRQADEQQLAGDLRRAFTLASTSGVIASPVAPSRLLEMIVRVAADVITSRAASLFLIDQEEQDLVFEVAIGPKAEAVEKFRVPLGHGVAGIVALTGQSMAVSNVQSDPRHAADISQSVGYLPQTILCVPLFYNDQVIGVLELLDKEGAASFGPMDIELLGLFANLAAVAIEQSRVQTNLVALIGEVLASFDHLTQGDPALSQRATVFAQSMASDESYRQTVEIAHLVEEIAHRGEYERTAVHAILRGFAEYLHARRDPSDTLGVFR